jgi:hypothetical protein
MIRRPRRCASAPHLVVASDSGIEWFTVAEDFPGWFERGRRIHPDSFAFDALRGKDFPAAMEPIPATAWFPERRWRDVIIREQAIRLGTCFSEAP